MSSFIEEATGDSHLRIEHDLGDGFVRLKSSEAEKRQAAQDIRCTEDIVIELLRNSRDAGANEFYIASHREDSARILTIVDNGQGIPTAMHACIFEPRVTSKLDTAHMDKWGMHGRGMALYSTKVNAERAHVVISEPRLGTSIQVETNLNKLGEKSDQSSFPSFEVQDNGAYAMRGPKNILRVAAEFALEHRANCNVWCGTPSEILATMYANGALKLDASQRIFEKDLDQTPFVLRPSYAFDADTLANIGTLLGLDVSSRTAHRILKGEIKPLPSLLERLKNESLQNKGERHERKPSAKSGSLLKLNEDELEDIKARATEIFQPIAQANYLQAGVDPIVKVDNGYLKIIVPLVSVED